MAIVVQSGLRPPLMRAPPLIAPPPDDRTAPIPPDERIDVEPKPLLPDLVPETEPRDVARVGWLNDWPPDLTAPCPAAGLAWDVDVRALREPR